MLGMQPSQRQSKPKEIEVLASNWPAFVVWRSCRKPLSHDWGVPQPAEVETAEIISVAQVLGLDMTPELHRRVVALDAERVVTARKIISDKIKANKGSR